MYRALLLSLLLLPQLVLSDAAIRPNGLILNETFLIEPGKSIDMPLYLTRRGEYYAELILEREDGQTRTTQLDLELLINISNSHKTLFERELATSLGRDRPVASLFWLTSDREIPIKQRLTLAVTLDQVEPAAVGETLRLQIRKKPNKAFRMR